MGECEDITARLRDGSVWLTSHMCYEAADEIERLRSERAEAIAQGSKYRQEAYDILQRLNDSLAKNSEYEKCINERSVLIHEGVVVAAKCLSSIARTGVHYGPFICEYGGPEMEAAAQLILFLHRKAKTESKGWAE